MRDTGGRKWLLWQHKFDTRRAFIRVRVGAVEQEIILKGFEKYLKYNLDLKERVDSKIA